MAIYESWDPIAHQLGFPDEETMLKTMYVDQGMSIDQLVRKLGYAKNSIRSRLKDAGVVLRKQGGPNSQGKTILSSLTNEELAHLKAADLLTLENEDGSRKFNCTPNTLYKEKRRRGLIVPTPKENQECTTPVSPQPPISTSTPEEDTSNFVLPTLPSETPSTSSGIEEDASPETL